MATTSFAAKTQNAEDAPPVIEGEATPVDGQPTEQPLATRPTGTVALPNQSGNFFGDWDSDDVRLSRINLVHKTSNEELITNFGIGAFCLEKEVKLSDGKEPFVVTAVRAKKDYIQKVPFGSNFDAKRFDTIDQVRKANFSTNYSDYTGKENSPYVMKRAHIEFVIAAPEGADQDALDLFPYEFEGKQYARAIFTVSSSAYTSVAKELATLTDKNRVMRKGAQYGKLELTSKTQSGKGDLSWKVPVIKYAGENTPEFVAFVEELTGFKS